jgi:hypothetical protein
MDFDTLGYVDSENSIVYFNNYFCFFAYLTKKGSHRFRFSSIRKDICLSSKRKAPPSFWQRLLSFVMRPHRIDIDGVGRFIHAIYEAVLPVDSPRVESRQIADEFFVGWRVLKGIVYKNFKELLCFFGKSSPFKQFFVFDRPFAKFNRPHLTTPL